MIHLPPTRPMLMKSAAIIVPPPAFVVTDLGLIDSASATQLVLTTGANSPAGSALLAFAGAVTAATGLASTSDSGGNAYTILFSDAAANSVAYTLASNALVLASGGTITANFNGVAGAHGLCAASVSGVSTVADPRDVAPAFTSSTGTSTTINSGVLAQAKEILWAEIGFNGDPGTITLAAGWQLFKSENTNGFFRIYYQIVNSTASVAFAPSWIPSRTFKARMFSLKGA